MATEQKDTEIKITAFAVAQLAGLLKQCTNVPMADINDFVTYLELREKLNEVAISLNNLQVEIFKSFSIQPDANGRLFVSQDHESFDKINAALESLMNKEHEIKGLKSLNISRLELAQMSIGLKNADVDFLKTWLTKPAA